MPTAVPVMTTLEKRVRPDPGRPVRFTVEQYHAIQDAGAIPELCRWELIHGQIVEKAVPKPAHVKTVRKLRGAFEAMADGTRFCVRIQDPVTLTDSEPEPDLAIVAAPLDRYDARHPVSADIALLVEVSETSLPSDRQAKAGLYAAAGVPVYWIVNLVEGIVEVYTQPRGTKYRKRVDYRKGDSVPIVLAKKMVGSISAQEFLP